ncbi:lasso peptide biosynthesis B2 protein [Sphingomonas sp. SUN039]|uniref:lasso peptide biosynthesis B2 protein n=1 Tax=Sphingomonas sp. SUN039 TaxID=2937787 RepID=UPI002164637E|nr:lasso peptide biosynthesis B2 protein [Sphingomonas sp. SUN039]UVO55781.1 lasso peptide biosynthesis B2 protein [Sphingomonas sp. SUN039]
MRRWLLLAEAVAALALASALIGLFSFRRIATISARGRKDAPIASTAAAREIGWVLAAWGRRVPWRAVCFQQGLAAQLMLRRRGRAATLYYGARHDENGKLVAHVWVRSGNADVIGCEDVEAYGLLAAFPGRDDG